MKLWSESFDDGSSIPEKNAFGKHAAEGHVALSDNLSPHLSWADAPAGTRSFAILCVDSEVPSSGESVNQEGKTVPYDLPRVDFAHWLAVDLPADLSRVAEGQFSEGVTPRGKGPQGPLGSRLGVNDYTSWFAGDADMSGTYHGYDGPCPPWNDERVHRYTFTVLALDVERLGVEGSFTLAETLVAIEGHVLARAAITGTYAIFPGARP